MTCVGHPDKGRSCRAKEENPDEMEDHMTGRRPCRLCQRRVRWHLCGPGKVRRYEPGARSIAMGFITRIRDFLAATDIASALSDVVRCPLEGRWGTGVSA